MRCVKSSLALLASGALLIAGGCSLPKGDFPSLAKRPYETERPIEEPAAAPEAVTTQLPAEMAASLAALESRHSRADAEFRSQLGRARQLAQAAAGAASGTESWAVAQVELSRLDAARADSLAALSEVDTLIAAQRDAGADPGLLQLLGASQARIAGDVDSQRAEIERLAAIIG